MVDLSETVRQRRLLSITPIDEVWGVGRRIAARLNTIGITTALELAECNLKTLRNQFSVVLERIARELRGESCLPLEQLPSPKKQIAVSRSFGQPVLTVDAVQSALSNFITRAAEKLRSEKQCARLLTVFMRTKPFRQSNAQYSNSAKHTLAVPTQDSRELLALTCDLSERIYRPGFYYARAGVMLGDFYAPGVFQPSLFETNEAKHESKALMNVIDKLNKTKTGTVYFASQKKTQGWQMKRERLSPAYTTRWADIPKV